MTHIKVDPDCPRCKGQGWYMEGYYGTYEKRCECTKKGFKKTTKNAPINIIFDGPPNHKRCRFVEVETDDGKSINAGKWTERSDGFWALRITELPGA